MERRKRTEMSAILEGSKEHDLNIEAGNALPCMSEMQEIERRGESVTIQFLTFSRENVLWEFGGLDRCSSFCCGPHSTCRTHHIGVGSCKQAAWCAEAE